jgi:hypothetical protein
MKLLPVLAVLSIAINLSACGPDLTAAEMLKAVEGQTGKKMGYSVKDIKQILGEPKSDFTQSYGLIRFLTYQAKDKAFSFMCMSQMGCQEEIRINIK